MHNTIIATWLHAETKETESEYPQVGGASSSPAFQEVYWRCIVVFFASSVRHNPDAKHRLYTTVSAVPDIGGFSTSGFLQKLGVEVIQVPLTYLPPPGYHGSWRNQFYILDIIKHLDTHGAPGEQYIVLDSDCVFVAPLDKLSRDLAEKQLLALDLKLPLDEDINGLTQRDMKRLFEELGVACPSEAAPYYGGEFFAATLEAVHRLAGEMQPLWEICLARFGAGKPKFNEEAHFLSYLYAKLGYGQPTANPHVGRIWTGRKHQTASESDFALAVWHVPSEKKHGIKHLYGQAIQPQSPFWTVAPGSDFARYAAGFLGIPKSSLLKKSRDLCEAVLWRAADKLTPKRVAS